VYAVIATLRRPFYSISLWRTFANVRPENMPLATIPTVTASDSRLKDPALLLGIARRPFELIGAPVQWEPTTYVALLALVALWAARIYATWATWGNLNVDCGHEMYVPAMLSEGKMLYRDVYYMYTPGAPYFNSYLFRLFGQHLEVLYWSGSLSALGCSLLLYASGMQLSSWKAGWTAGAVVLIQSFQPYIFNFPLPYAYASVYGCLSACLFLWFAIRASTSQGWVWIFGAGSSAAAALLFKPEMGVACYVALMLLVALRRIRFNSWGNIRKDIFAILPGLAICSLVIRWMVSIAGATFITQENIMSWPTSFFMKTYGKRWLESSGFSLNGHALVGATLRTLLVAMVLFGFAWVLRRSRPEAWQPFVGAAFLIAALAFGASWLPSWGETAFRWIFFPQDMVLYVAIAALAAWWCFWQEPAARHTSALAIVLTFSSLFARRSSSRRRRKTQNLAQPLPAFSINYQLLFQHHVYFHMLANCGRAMCLTFTSLQKKDRGVGC
jgi:Dolichyl-phosphate-mannose-protein mannosyltransferase